MAAGDHGRAGELRISLEQLLIVHDAEGDDDYRDNYVRRMTGPILLVSDEPETESEKKIGEVELVYFDGSSAVDNRLDILDVADSVGEEEYRYAKAVYAGGALDPDIVAEPLSNDLLATAAVTILAEYLNRDYGTQVVRKIVETVGYHCGAVVIRSETGADNVPEVVAEEEPGYGSPLELRPTKDPSIFLVIEY